MKYTIVPSIYTIQKISDVWLVVWRGCQFLTFPLSKKSQLKQYQQNHCQGEWKSSTGFFAALSQTYSHRQAISRRTETRKTGNWPLLQLQTGQEGHSSSPKNKRPKKWISRTKKKKKNQQKKQNSKETLSQQLQKPSICVTHAYATA